MQPNPHDVLQAFNQEAERNKKYYKQEDLFTGEIIQKVMATMNMQDRCIDFRGLKKYLISAYFFEMLIFKLVNEDKKRSWWFDIIVGRGDRTVGSRLKPRVLELCKQVYGIPVHPEEKNDRIPIKIDADTANRIKLIEEMKNTLKKLKQFKGADQPEERLIMGFARGGCPALVTEYWEPKLTDQGKAELLGRVWPTIVNLFSHKFIQAMKDSELADEQPHILEQFQKLYKEKPKTWHEVFNHCQEKKKYMCAIHTFSAYPAELYLDGNFRQVQSPSITEVKELLTNENKHLVFVFDEAIDNREDNPLTKKLREVQKEVQARLQNGMYCFIILCLNPESNGQADYMPYNKAWVEFMVDNLLKQEEKGKLEAKLA